MKRALLAIASLALLAGCDQSQSNMGDQPKYNTERAANRFGNGASARPWIAGTVARPDEDVPGIPYAWHDAGTPAHRSPRGLAAPEASAFPVTPDLIARGQTYFNADCSACHGRLGNGQGMIVQRGMPVPPSFHVPRLLDAPDQHFFDVITNGYGAMFSHAQQTTVEQRWAIVAYVRALQAAGKSAPGDVRTALIARGDTGHVLRPPVPGGPR